MKQINYKEAEFLLQKGVEEENKKINLTEIN